VKRIEKIKKLLEDNYNFKINKFLYIPKDNHDLIKIVSNLIIKHGNNVDLNNIYVSNIDDFSYVFNNKINFRGDVSRWDVSNGKFFDYIFFNCHVFNSDLYTWDVSNGESFNGMFSGCYRFNNILKKWDVFNGENFNNMFQECKRFESDISKWNVSNAKSWKHFAKDSLLEMYPERIPEKFRLSEHNKEFRGVYNYI
jgi:surface protein